MSATALPRLPAQSGRTTRGSSASGSVSSVTRLPPLPRGGGGGGGGGGGARQSGSSIAIGRMRITLTELKKPQNSFDNIQRELAHIDMTRFGKSVFESTCLDMLEGGYHRAFKELFNSNEQQKEDREKGGKDSGYYYDPLVSDSEEKLQQMNTFLTSAEDAMRQGNTEQVYDAQLQLAQYFEETEDTWLSDRLYQAALATATTVNTDSRQREGTAHANIGLSLEGRGQYEEAAKHFGKFHKLAAAADPPWYTMSGENMVKSAATHMCRIYTTMAEEVFDEDSEKSIKYLKNSLEKSKHVDARAEGLAHYRLGNVYQAIQKHSNALEHHKAYLEKSRHSQDQQGIGAACEALALACESMERWDDAMQYHELLAEAARRTSDAGLMSQATSQLGMLKNMLGRFDEAVQLSDKCYMIQTSGAPSDGGTTAVASARARYGMSNGHEQALDFTGRLLSGVSMLTGLETLQDVIRWKDCRIVDAPAVAGSSSDEVPQENPEGGDGSSEGQEGPSSGESPDEVKDEEKSLELSDQQSTAADDET